MLAFELCSVTTAALFSRSRQRRREERGAQFVSALSVGGLAYAGSGKLSTSYQPGGLAYYRVSRTIPTEKRLALALAAAAISIAATRRIMSDNGNGDLACALRSIGRLPLKVEDAWERLLARRAEAERRRHEAERQEWLRAHTQPAKIYRQR